MDSENSTRSWPSLKLAYRGILSWGLSTNYVELNRNNGTTRRTTVRQFFELARGPLPDTLLTAALINLTELRNDWYRRKAALTPVAWITLDMVEELGFNPEQLSVARRWVNDPLQFNAAVYPWNSLLFGSGPAIAAVARMLDAEYFAARNEYRESVGTHN